MGYSLRRVVLQWRHKQRKQRSQRGAGMGYWFLVETIEREGSSHHDDPSMVHSIISIHTTKRKARGALQSAKDRASLFGFDKGVNGVRYAYHIKPANEHCPERHAPDCTLSCSVCPHF
jgi:hypothetical protein